MAGDSLLPKPHDLIWPTIQALQELGGSGTIQEIFDKVVEMQGFSEEQQQVLHLNGPDPEIKYRLAWARTPMKAVGLITNSSRGVWALTEEGRRCTEAEAEKVPERYRQLLTSSTTSTPPPEGPQELDYRWREELIEILRGIPPASFERLCLRLVREAGFTEVNVTGRSGDEGIDGVALHRVSLLSFPVFFQCKRYRGTVGPNAVRDFRGAMAGRGEHGVLITTGNFTKEARNEAKREGARRIDLIDGNQFCDLLKEHAVGLKVETRDHVEVDQAFFEHL